MPVFVASLTAFIKGSNFGLNATVKAQSIILPNKPYSGPCKLSYFILITADFSPVLCPT